MPELNEKLLNRLGIAEAMAHRAKATAGRLQQAAAKHHDSANADIDALGKQIEAAGVGADEDAENRYCRALVARGYMAQAHHLAGLDAARMPEVGASLEKGQESFNFDEEKHPRAGKGEPNGGQFVAKGESADPTHTTAFRNWFGSSKVVGANGEPLVVYHGSSEKFDRFDPKRKMSTTNNADYGLGFYFSPKRGMAEEYARQVDPTTGDVISKGHVHELFLSIQNPWPAEEPLTLSEWNQVWEALPEGGVLKTEGAFLKKAAENDIRSGVAAIAKKRLVFQFFPGHIPGELRAKAWSEVHEALEKLGYDGVHGDGEWIAWHPQQIKGVDNEGSFDPANPNMNKAVRRTFHHAGQGAMDFEENQHPRAAEGTAGRYKPGEFVPKGEQSDRVEAAAQSAQEDGHPGLAEAHQDLDPTEDWKKNGVRAQSFKSWFGDWENDPKNASKVIDPETGEPEETFPVKLYHGTQADFRAFDPEQLARSTGHPTAQFGFFFSESETIARTFAGEMLREVPEKDLNALAREQHGVPYHYLTDQDVRRDLVKQEADQPKKVVSDKPKPEGSRVLTCYLNIRNPYRMELKEWNEKFVVPSWLSKQSRAETFDRVKEFKQQLMDAGYDGMVLGKSEEPKSSVNEYSARSYIAFHPEQIKSSENEGTFDPSSADMKKSVRRPFVPPDMPRWRGPRPSPNSYLPLNGVEDREKFLAMAKEMAAGTWTWDKPLIRCGDQLLTGSHRYAAAQTAGVPIETLDVGDLFKRCGLDFQETWGRLAQPYTSWLNNMDAALKTLPPEILALFGIDLG